MPEGDHVGFFFLAVLRTSCRLLVIPQDQIPAPGKLLSFPELGEGSQDVIQHFLKPQLKAELGTVFSGLGKGLRVWEQLGGDKERF